MTEKETFCQPDSIIVPLRDEYKVLQSSNTEDNYVLEEKIKLAKLSFTNDEKWANIVNLYKNNTVISFSASSATTRVYTIDFIKNNAAHIWNMTCLNIKSKIHNIAMFSEIQLLIDNINYDKEITDVYYLFELTYQNHANILKFFKKGFFDDIIDNDIMVKNNETGYYYIKGLVRNNNNTYNIWQDENITHYKFDRIDANNIDDFDKSDEALSRNSPYVNLYGTTAKYAEPGSFGNRVIELRLKMHPLKFEKIMADCYIHTFNVSLSHNEIINTVFTTTIDEYVPEYAKRIIRNRMSYIL